MFINIIFPFLRVPRLPQYALKAPLMNCEPLSVMIRLGTPKRQPGDMVLRKRQNLEGLNKMSSKWEGPFRVTHTLKPGTV